MKLTYFVICLIVLCSCGVSKQHENLYYFIEPFEEQEVKLQFNNDSTFTMRDVTGCNQFGYSGRFTKVQYKEEAYILLNSVEAHKVPFSSYKPFIITSSDTLWILNDERIFIHNKPFAKTTKTNINLQSLRYKKLEEYYIGLLGKKGFIQTFGGGKGLSAAKKILLECRLPDIKLK
jgi:hypothetical protein